MTFIVQQEKLPERCEVCHQTDEFDPETGICRRCGRLSLSPDGDGRAEVVRRERTFLGRRMSFRKDPPPNGFTSLEEARQNRHLLQKQLNKSRIPWVAFIVGLISLLLFGLSQFQPYFQKQNTEKAAQLLRTFQLRRMAGLPVPDARLCRVATPNQTADQFRLEQSFAGAFAQIDYEMVRGSVPQPASTASLEQDFVIFPKKTWWAEQAGTDCFYLDETGVIRHSGSASAFPDKNSTPLE